MQVERLIRTKVDHLACAEVVHLGSSEAPGIRGVYTFGPLSRGLVGRGLVQPPKIEEKVRFFFPNRCFPKL